MAACRSGPGATPNPAVSALPGLRLSWRAGARLGAGQRLATARCIISTAQLDPTGALDPGRRPSTSPARPTNASLNPQVVTGVAGAWYVVWTEAAPSGIPPTVYFSRCSGGAMLAARPALRRRGALLRAPPASRRQRKPSSRPLPSKRMVASWSPGMPAMAPCSIPPGRRVSRRRPSPAAASPTLALQTAPPRPWRWR